jgi:hypothetical protein
VGPRCRGRKERSSATGEVQAAGGAEEGFFGAAGAEAGIFGKIRSVRGLARVEGKLVSGGWEELV